MNKSNKFVGIYYPDSWIENKISFASFCLFFDELHFMNSYIYEEWYGSDPIKCDRLDKFFKANWDLLDKVIFYDPDPLYYQNRDELLKEVLEIKQELDHETITKYSKSNKHADVWVISTALYYAEKLNWIPVGDIPELPIHFPRNVKSSVEYLSSLLAEECFRIVLPACFSAHPEDILEIREKAKDVLEPFRMAMFSLTSTLRSYLSEQPSHEELRRESRFVINSYVRPTLCELQRKISLERGSLWRRMFGKAIGWLPLIGQAFMTPNPSVVYKAIEKAGKDMEELLLLTHNSVANIKPGIGYLLLIEQMMKKYDPQKQTNNRLTMP